MAALPTGCYTPVHGELRAAASVIRLVRRTPGTLKGNLFWAFG
ncbi:hypothetical protein [Streptomyces sp. NPDC020965]